VFTEKKVLRRHWDVITLKNNSLFLFQKLLVYAQTRVKKLYLKISNQFTFISGKHANHTMTKLTVPKQKKTQRVHRIMKRRRESSARDTKRAKVASFLMESPFKDFCDIILEYIAEFEG
jgi:hypothetical protein